MYGIEIAYTGRDNSIDIELRENGVNLPDYSLITRVKITFDDTNSIDSDTAPQLLDWTGDKLIIKAGLAGIMPGRYSAKVETWDSDHLNGLVWTDSLKVEVRA